MILHAHLFKNAGSTLDWSLQRSFGDKFLDHRDDAELRDNPEALEALVVENPHLAAISSHWMPLPLTPQVASRSALLIMLRHPIDRARSVYAFERGQTGFQGPSAVQARKLDFRDFVSWRLEEGRGPVMRNYQVRYLSGDFRGNIEKTLLPRAKAQLENALFGIVERHDESMVLFEHILLDQYPEVDLAAPPQNVSRRGNSGLKQRLEEIQRLLGPVYDQLLDENRLDLALYEWAVDRFTGQLSEVSELPEKVLDMRTRRRKLM